MSGTDWVANDAGLAAIGWVNCFFFVAGRTPAVARAASTGMPEVRIAVRGGYEPATVRVKAGAPVRLVFDRQETSSCSEEVVFPAFGIRKFLPTGKPTSIEVTPPAPGRYEFMCGMAMLRGALIAEA
jgi:plastocyanin domain-containing protein